MTPIPSPVRNVRVYPYIPDAPIEVPPVFENGAGTLSVGTLATLIFYNLDLTSGGPRNGGVHAGVRYYAVYDGENGQNQTTPWMTCLQGGEQPRFGRTIDMQQPQPAGSARTSNDASQGDIAYQIHMKDVAVSLYVNPKEPLEIPLLNGGTGVATFIGTLPGGTWSVTVDGGQRVNPLIVGAGVTITGNNVFSGKPFHIPAVLRTTDAGDPAVFVQPTPR